jgi:diaminopimelate epimerase
MRFTKMQGAGNDFVVVDGRGLDNDWSAMAMRVTDRHLGIGSDSLIVLLESETADFGMRTWDTDGSEAETCGNGIRCVARYVLEKGFADRGRSEITIETLAGINYITFEHGDDGRINGFVVNMGRARFTEAEIPFSRVDGDEQVTTHGPMTTYTAEVAGRPVDLNLISMGNPHAILYLDYPVADFPMEVLGPLVERLPVFPERVNFEVARVLDDDRIEARVWERGVGETQACGSGASAITISAKMLEYTADRVSIHFPGGVLRAWYDGTGDIVLAGPAEIVYEGEWPE